MVIIFVVLAIQYWVGEDIRKAEEEKRGTWLFTLEFIGLTVLTMLAANIPGQVQQDQYLYLTKEHTEQLEKVLLREATADSERCIQWYEKQMLGIRNNKALGNPAMQTEDERQYKNRIDGKEVYRDPDTCTLRVKELKDGSTKDSLLINGPVGEIIAMRERIFYIDMEDHNVLKSVTYDGRKRKTWTKDPVKQFAVIGGYVICCTEDEKLIRCDMSTGKRKELADHIQYFFAGAKLYAQKGSKIVSVSYDGKEVRVFKKDVVMTQTEARNTLAKFLFYGESVFKKVKGLSGGEKSRLLLCKLIQQDVNLLILDEPTNHLDIESRENLEEALQSFQGTLLFISHDRYFINKLAKRVTEIHNQKLSNYIGDYNAYKEKKLQQQKGQEEKENQSINKEASKQQIILTERKNRSMSEKPKKRNEGKIAYLEKCIHEYEAQLEEITAQMDSAAADYNKWLRLDEEKQKLEKTIEPLMEEWLKLQEG